MIIQYAGDYREAYKCMQESGVETYYGHRYVLQQLEAMKDKFGAVAMLCCLSGERYITSLPNGVTVMGADANPQRQAGVVKRMIDDWDPTHLVVLGPLTSIIRHGLQSQRQVHCQFADSFGIPLWKRLLKYGALASLLNDDRIDWVSNHGVNACLSLASIGVAPKKLIAWDWPYDRSPSQILPRVSPGSQTPRLLFVGSVNAKKGVGDLIASVALLRSRGISVGLQIAGGGEIDHFREQAAASGVNHQVEFLGLIPNAEVFELMKEATAVVVPSRHDYPEGLPLTIYEALCARAPIIASDHPMFAGHLVDGETAMVFRQRDAGHLAEKIEALLSDDRLYHRLSANGEGAWLRMQNEAKWGEIITRWVSSTDEDRRWLRDHSFSRTSYPPAPVEGELS